MKKKYYSLYDIFSNEVLINIANIDEVFRSEGETTNIQYSGSSEPSITETTEEEHNKFIKYLKGLK